MPAGTASIVAGLLLFLLASVGCTQRYTVPKDKQPCANGCVKAQTTCMNHCAEDKGNPAVLEDIRGGLCEKRCKEGYDNCMLSCV